MRTIWSILFTVLLLGPVAGCGSDPAVEMPENPAPKTEGGLVPESSSVPADSAPSGSP